MKAGFAKISILPKEPVSLAGYAKDMPRLYTHVLDEPQARAIALSDDRHAVIVISGDFLTPSDRLAAATKAYAREKLPAGGDIVLHAHHTHSGPGNYWDHPVAKHFMGAFRQEVFEFMASRFAEAAVRAWIAQDHALVRFAQEDLHEGLQENRRRADGPLDPKLSAFGFHHADGRPMGAIVHFSGHPVIVAERDFLAASGDFPGAVSARLEKEFPICLFLNGALGGLSIWFPETPIEVREHLGKVADPIAKSAEKLINETKSTDAGIAFSRQTVALPTASAKPFPPGYAWWTPIFHPVVMYWDHIAKKGFSEPRVTTLSALRIGEAAFVFHPSDFGVGSGLRTRENGKAAGLHAIPVCHADDYAGYIHPASEMLIKPKPEKEFRFMTIYENLMGFHGRGAYARFEEAEKKALGEISLK